MSITCFTVTVHGEYVREEIPPRCRKPRLVAHDTSATVTVPVVAPEDAPVAFRVANLGDTGSTEYRLHNHTLYRLKNVRPGREEPVRAGSPRFPADYTISTHELHGRVDSAEAFASAAEVKFSRYIIIGNLVWEEIGEPRYVVQTFGLGGNHGGTGLLVDLHDNPNLPASSYFRADEFEEACQYAITVAEDRGDTDDVEQLRNNPERFRDIEVLIPEAVTLITPPPTPERIRDLRWEYRLAVDALHQSLTTDAEGEAEAFRAMVGVRKEIIDAGYCVVNSDVRPYEMRAFHASSR